ncbi:hypothetical protein IWZ03DRAFT_16529, partial [Phyllosticta citriasiana]
GTAESSALHLICFVRPKFQSRPQPLHRIVISLHLFAPSPASSVSKAQQIERNQINHHITRPPRSQTPPPCLRRPLPLPHLRPRAPRPPPPPPTRSSAAVSTRPISASSSSSTTCAKSSANSARSSPSASSSRPPTRRSSRKSRRSAGARRRPRPRCVGWKPNSRRPGAERLLSCVNLLGALVWVLLERVWAERRKWIMEGC